MLKFFINKMVFLSASCLCLQGCFWGAFGGSVKVQNDTDATIYVSVDHNNINDGGYFPRDMSINARDSAKIPLRSFTFDPDLFVEYNDLVKTYRTHLNFFGLDTVYVNIKDFQHYNSN